VGSRTGPTDDDVGAAPVSDEGTTNFRFPTLERRGLAGGLRVGQVAILSTGSVAAVLVLRSSPTVPAALLAVLLVAASLAAVATTVRGRGLDEWAPVAAVWLVRRAGGGLAYRSSAPFVGHRWTGQALVRELDQPPALDGVALLAFDVNDQEVLGVIRDRAQRSYAAVLAASVRSFGLLGAADQERQLAAWGRVLASVARDGSCIRRVQALERTVPHDGDELRGWLAEAATGRPDGRLRTSYEALLEVADELAYEHEVLLAVQVDERRAWASMRGAAHRGATPEALACTALAREVRLLAARLAEADINVRGVLSPTQLSATMRTGHDPYGSGGRESAPAAAEATWDRYQCDRTVHRTYWVAQWPRLEVGAGFMLPLLLGPTAVRSISIVAQPIPPARSRAAVEAAITSDEADEQVRRERGFRTTARTEQQRRSARRRESELAAGHEELRFAGFVTVSGRDRDELDRACEAVLQAAQQSYLDLQLMYGQQDTGFACGALPLCRGLGRGGLLDP
jgi:hypothetical protein